MDITAPVTLAPVLVTGESSALTQLVDPDVGARVYILDQKRITSQGKGEDSGVDQVLLETPGVSRETSGQFHVRGEDYGLQYRINGVLLPEGITSTLGQPFDSRLIESLSLITGALPAQYGLRTAGIVDIQTKTGSDLKGQDVSMYGGSHGTLQPSLSSGGKEGATDYFFTGSFLQSDLGTENVTSSKNAIHDQTQQYQGFGLVTQEVAPGQKLSFIFSGADAHFQIPNAPGLEPIYSYEGQSTFNSGQLNRNQLEQNYYGIVSYQVSTPDLMWQVSEVNSYSSTHYEPDAIGDLMFTGVSSDAERDLIGNGIQFDSTYYANENHTIRAGVSLTSQLEQTRSTNQVFATDSSTGLVLSDLPETIRDSSDQRGYVYGFYVQDAWQLGPDLTLNLGGRLDFVNAYVDQLQLSPRLSFVYTPTTRTTFHVGYARLFSPPLQEFIRQAVFSQFVHTTNAPETLQDSAPQSARSHSFDVGVTQEIVPGLVMGLDAYYTLINNMQDETQLGSSLSYTPFSYKRGYKTGLEGTISYQQGPWMVYSNVAIAESKGRDINSSQGLFGADELVYLSSHSIHTDYDQLVTLSAGAAYTWSGTTIHGDVLYGSGMFGGFANGDQLPGHVTLDLGVAHTFTLSHRIVLTVKFDVINAFDSNYLLHDAGIGATTDQYGERRGLFGGINCSF